MSAEQNILDGQESPKLFVPDLNKLENVVEEVIRDPQYIDLSPYLPERLKLTAHGIELKRDYTDVLPKEGDRFENRCFGHILSKRSSYFVFGPCLTDSLLGQPFTTWDSKPDGIAFDISDGKKWRLTDLYEFKATRKSRRVDDKLFGLSRLLQKLRENPDYLPILLYRSLAIALRLPVDVEIPDDDKITVTLVYPSKGPIREKPQTSFRLKYLRVPYQKPTY